MQQSCADNYMKKAILILLIITGLMAYTLLLAPDLEREFTSLPEWTSSPEGKPPAPAGTGSGGYPFALSELFGYVSVNGNLLFTEEIRDGVALGPEGFVNYAHGSGPYWLQKPDGSIITLLQRSGSPFMMERRLFFLSRDHRRVEEVSFDDTLLWRRGFASVITALDAQTGEDESRRGTLIGLLNGDILLLDGQGRQRFRETVTGSRYNAVYGCGLSASGTEIVAVAGIDPQRLLVWAEREGAFSLISEIPLGSAFRRTLFTGFIGEERYYAEVDDGILVGSLDGSLRKVLPLPGPLLQVNPAAHGGTLSLLVDAGQAVQWIRLAAADGTVLSVHSLPPGTSLAQPAGAGTLLGGGNRLVKIGGGRL